MCSSTWHYSTLYIVLLFLKCCFIGNFMIGTGEKEVCSVENRRRFEGSVWVVIVSIRHCQCRQPKSSQSIVNRFKTGEQSHSTSPPPSGLLGLINFGLGSTSKGEGITPLHQGVYGVGIECCCADKVNNNRYNA